MSRVAVEGVSKIVNGSGYVTDVPEEVLHETQENMQQGPEETVN